jgi:hypothetical chaperone protein
LVLPPAATRSATAARSGSRPRLAIRPRLRHEAGPAAKAALSAAETTRLSFHHKELAIDTDLNRADFEARIAPDLAQFAAAVDRFGPERLSTGGAFVSLAEGRALIGRDRP